VDIIERAEAAMADGYPPYLVAELITELKAARAENERLLESIESLTPEGDWAINKGRA
jgi:hypothetical protein